MLKTDTDNEAQTPLSTIVNCVAYSTQEQNLGAIPIERVREVLQQENTFVWIGVYEPSEALLNQLQKEFDLHPLAIEDAQHAHQRQKIETYGDCLFLVVHTAQEEQGHITFGETHAFLGPRYLITVRHGASKSYAPARARCERELPLFALGPSYGLYAVLDLIVDNFEPIATDFRNELTQLETRLFSQEFSRETIQRLYEHKKELMLLLLAISPMQNILNQLVHLHPTVIREEVRMYFRDVYDHVVRTKETCETLSEMLSVAMHVNLAMVSVGQNEVVKRLASWAALLAAPTLITSWYGMNFKYMPELSQPFGYAGVIALTGAVCVGVYFALKRAKWL